MSKYRYTIDTLQSGQPRPYADTTLHVRVTLEWQGMEGFSNKDAPFIPQDKMQEQTVRELLRGLRCGFTDKEPENWASTRLDWLRNPAPGVWEFHTTSPFTD